MTRTLATAAIVQQLVEWRKQGQDHIYFGALAIHPETDEDCTFGDLIDALSKPPKLTKGGA